MLEEMPALRQALAAENVTQLTDVAEVIRILNAGRGDDDVMAAYMNEIE